MRKIVLTFAVMMTCLAANAQEPEKKKEASTPPPSRGQERAINESGVSVKTDSKKPNSSAKQSSAPAPAPEDKKKEAKHDDAKKPE